MTQTSASLLVAAVWTVASQAVFIPVANHVFGLAHGFKNTIGVVAFFFIGPVNGLW